MIKLAENKLLVHRYYDEVLNWGRPGALAELLAADFVDRRPAPGETPDAAGLARTLERCREAFPDLFVTVEQMVAEGDWVAARSTWRGTQEGEFLGIPPAGQAVAVLALEMWRIAGGRLAERWASQYELDLREQIGALPARVVG